MSRLDDILRRHGVQPVGKGYLDRICPKEEAALFLEDLRAAGITVTDCIILGQEFVGIK